MAPSSNPWKSLAEELGTPWQDEPEAAEVAAPEETFPAPPPPVVAEEVRREETAESTAPLPMMEGDLFAETSDEEPLAPVNEIADEPAPPTPAMVPPLEPVAPVVDKSHWRSLLGELGLEAPPEPEPELAPSETAPPAARTEAGPERFRSANDEVGKTEAAAERRSKGEKPRAASAEPSRPFGGGLFSDDEEHRFVRAAPQVEAEPETAATAEEEVAPEAAPAAADETAPRKRGRRRTRSWSRLHSQTQEPEVVEAEVVEAEVVEPVANLEAAELAEEVETADDLFGEEAPAETAAEEEDEGERRRRPRHRRRRSRRGERPAEERETRGARSEDGEEEEPQGDLFAEEEESEEEFELEDERPPRERRRRREAAEASSPDIEEEDGEEELEGERPAHRKIPTWEEAVGLVISINMETRAKTPGGRRRR